MVCTDVMGFSGRLIFHFQINRSGRPVLTFWKRKKSLYSFVWVLRLFFLSYFYLAVYSRKEESHWLRNKTTTLNLTRRGKYYFKWTKECEKVVLMFIFLANLKKVPSRMGARDMSRNVCIGENSPNFDEHVMTKQMGRFERGDFDQHGDFGVYGQLSTKWGECYYMHGA